MRRVPVKAADYQEKWSVLIRLIIALAILLEAISKFL
jgi:hypothetical protein